MAGGGTRPDIEKVAPRISHWRRLGFPRRPLAARLELPGFNFGVIFGSLISITDFGVILVVSWVPRAPKKLSFHLKGCKNQLFTDARFFIVLGFLREVILAPIRRLNSHCDSLSGILDAK